MYSMCDRGTVCRLGMWLLLATFTTLSAHGNIDLEWRPTAQTVAVGDSVDLALYAVSDSDEDQLLSVVEVIFTWDATYLELLGLDQDGAVDLASSGFPTSGDCDLNELVPPEDGDGLYQAWANFGEPVPATPEGTLLTTFQFEALVGTIEPSGVLMLSSNGACRTVVVDGVIPGWDVTGALGSATATITCTTNGDCDDGLFCNGEETCDGDSCVAGTDPCPGQPCDEIGDVCTCPNIYDLDGSCFIDSTDLGLFAACWLLFEGDEGWTENGCDDKDFDCSGIVDSTDLGLFAGAWLKSYDEIDPAAYPECRACEGEVTCP